LASGDRFSYRITAREGATVTVTTAACERVYRSPDGIPATIDSHLSAGPGAYVEWLPQETILFDRSAILRRLVVDIAAAASALVAEAVILGRAAHGEQVETGTFHDDWRFYRGGRSLLKERRLQPFYARHRMRLSAWVRSAPFSPRPRMMRWMQVQATAMACLLRVSSPPTARHCAVS
jgi:urease accessory protein UreH